MLMNEQLSRRIGLYSSGLTSLSVRGSLGGCVSLWEGRWSGKYAGWHANGHVCERANRRFVIEWICGWAVLRTCRCFQWAYSLVGRQTGPRTLGLPGRLLDLYTCMQVGGRTLGGMAKEG